jgi:hypothetical protein
VRIQEQIATSQGSQVKVPSIVDMLRSSSGNTAPQPWQANACRASVLIACEVIMG